MQLQKRFCERTQRTKRGRAKRREQGEKSGRRRRRREGAWVGGWVGGVGWGGVGWGGVGWRWSRMELSVVRPSNHPLMNQTTGPAAPVPTNQTTRGASSTRRKPTRQGGREAAAAEEHHQPNEGLTHQTRHAARRGRMWLVWSRRGAHVAAIKDRNFHLDGIWARTISGNTKSIFVFMCTCVCVSVSLSVSVFLFSACAQRCL